MKKELDDLTEKIKADGRRMTDIFQAQTSRKIKKDKNSILGKRGLSKQGKFRQNNNIYFPDHPKNRNAPYSSIQINIENFTIKVKGEPTKKRNQK